jgi:hypothetical protein
MEKFMLIFRGSDVYQPGQSPEALRLLTEKMMTWVGALARQGHHLDSQPLQRQGKVISAQTVADVPFGDDRAIIGGSTLIQADSMAHATHIAQACPILATGATIEIRPVLIYGDNQ